MHYVNFGPLQGRLNRTAEYAALAAEYGCGKEVAAVAARLEEALRQAEDTVRALEADPILREKEPGRVRRHSRPVRRGQHAETAGSP